MKITRLVAVLASVLAICAASGVAGAQSPRPVPGGPLPKGPAPGPLGHATDLIIRKSAVGLPFGVGLAANFSIVVTNAGPSSVSAARGVYVTDTLPASFGGLVLASGGGWICSVSGLTVSCHYIGGPVGSGGSFPPIMITAEAMRAGGFANCAGVNLVQGPDLNPGNNRSCIDGVIPPRVTKAIRDMALGLER